MPAPVDYYSPTRQHFHPRRHRLLKSLAILLSACLLLILLATVWRIFNPAFHTDYQPRATSLQQALLSQVELYKLDHTAPLDFIRYPSWQQLIGQTTPEGKPVPYGPADRGPYINATPTNPLNGLQNVATISSPASTNPTLPSPAGFIHFPATDQILLTDGTGLHPHQPDKPSITSTHLLQLHYANRNPISGTLHLLTHRDGTDPLWFLLIPLVPSLLLTLLPLLLILRTLRRWRPPPGTITNPST